MATVIKSMNDLTKILESRIRQAMKMTRDEIYHAIDDSIEQYYEEYEPKIYERTYTFLESLVYTDVQFHNGTLQCSVHLAEGFLNHTYPYTEKFNPSYPHDYDGRFAMGINVAQWANWKFPEEDRSGYNHGYTVPVYNTGGFWDRAIKKLGGREGILEKFKGNLRKCGVPVV